MATRADYFKLHFIVFVWGFSGILGKLVEIPAYEMVFFRGILSSIGIGLVMLFMRENFRVSTKQFFHSDWHRIYCGNPLAGIFRIGKSLERLCKSCWICNQLIVDRHPGTRVQQSVHKKIRINIGPRRHLRTLHNFFIRLPISFWIVPRCLSGIYLGYFCNFKFEAG